MGVIEPGDQEIYIKDSLSKTVNNVILAVLMLCVCVRERDLTIKFLSERVGSIQQDVGFRVNRLQLFQRGLPPTDTLHVHTHTHRGIQLSYAVYNFVWCSQRSVSSSDNSPHTALWVRSPADETRCSGSGRRAPGGCWCFHTYTGASAWESRTPGLRKHTLTHLLTTAGWKSISQMTGNK